MFISFLYMFQAAMCPSSEEITVSVRLLVLVMQGGMKLVSFHPAYQTVILTE